VRLKQKSNEKLTQWQKKQENTTKTVQLICTK